MTSTPPEPQFTHPGYPDSAAPPPPAVWPAAPAQFPPAPGSFPPASGQFPPAPGSFPPPGSQARQEMIRAARRRNRTTRHIIVGVIWGAIALILAAGAVGEFLIGIPGGGVLCLVFALGCGWYDYRVWTGKARRYIIPI